MFYFTDVVSSFNKIQKNLMIYSIDTSTREETRILISEATKGVYFLQFDFTTFNS